MPEMLLTFFTFFFLLVRGEMDGYLKENNNKYLEHGYSVISSEEKNGRILKLLSFFNSSSSLDRISFVIDGKSFIGSVSCDSNLIIRNSMFKVNVDVPALFDSCGKISLNKVNLVPNENSNFRYSSIASFSSLYNNSAGISKTPSLIVMNSLINNMINEEHEGDFLGIGYLYEEVVEQCVFNNVTRGRTNTRKELLSSVSFCKLSGNIMNGIEDYIYGGIISGLSCLSTEKMLCSNCSFENCFREKRVRYSKMNKNERGNKNFKYLNNSFERKNDISQFNVLFTEQQDKIGDSYGNFNFSTCNFTNCVAKITEGGGGALFANNTKILYLSRDNFNECSAVNGNGGGVFCYNVQGCYFNECSFCNCSAINGGGLCAKEVNEINCISELVCCNCSCTGNGGSVLIMNSSYGNVYSDYSYVIFSCRFFNSSADEDGGGLFLEPKGCFLLKDCYLENCHANGYSGGIDYYLDPNLNKNEILSVFLLFNNNTADIKGNDLIIRSDDLSEMVNPLLFCFSISNHSGRLYFANGSESSWDYNEKDKLLENDSSRCFIYPYELYSVDGLSCGTVYFSGCKSLGKAIENMINNTINYIIPYYGTNFTDTSVTFEKYKYIFYGISYDGDFCTVNMNLNSSSENSSYFIVNSGELCFYNILLVIGYPFTQPVFSINFQALVSFKDFWMYSDYQLNSYVLPIDSNLYKFDNTYFYSIYLYNRSFFGLTSSNNLSINNVSFESIYNQDGNGGVICLSLDSNQKFHMNNVSFYGNYASNGKGGSFYLVLPDYSQMTFSNVNFHLDYYGNDNIYCIVCQQLNETAHYLSQFSDVFNTSMSLFYAVGSFKENEDCMPLTLFLRDELSEAYVHNGGIDNVVCGYEDYPCYSLLKAFENLGSKKKIVKFIQYSFLYGEHLLNNNSYNISAYYYNYYFDIEVVSGTFISSVESYFENISFYLPYIISGFEDSSPDSVSLFSCISSNLFLSNINFSHLCSYYLMYHVFNVNSEGHMYLVNVSFEYDGNITLYTQLFVIDIGGNANLTDVRIRNIETITQMNGSVISASIGENNELYFNNCLFNICKNEEGKGGVMYLHIYNKSSDLSLLNTSFYNIACNSGTYLYLLCENGSYTPPLSHFYGTLDNYVQPYEKDYLVESISPSISASLLHYLFSPYWNPTLTNIYIGGRERGVESDGCGWEDLPCENFKHAWTITDRMFHFVVCGETEIIESLECPEKVISVKGSEEEEKYKNLLFTSSLSSHGFIVSLNSAYLDISKLNFEKNDYNLSFFGAYAGSLSLHECSFSSPISSSVVSVIPPPLSSSILYLSLKNLTLPSDSDISVVSLDSSNSEGSSENIRLDISLNFEESNKNPVISLTPITCTITLTGNISCSSEGSVEGGAVKACLRENGSFNLFSLSAKDCKASKKEGEDGKGGFLFLDCVDPVLKDINVEALPAANFLVHSTTFTDNEAEFGRDIFIYCYSVNSQINLNMFLIDFSTNFNSVNALYGCDVNDIDISSKYVDILRTKEYLSEHIYISSLKSIDEDLTICGSEENPCRSLDQGYRHTVSESYNSLTIINKTFIKQSFSMVNVSVQKSKDSKEKAVIYLDDNYSGRGIDTFIFSLSSKASFNDILFFFSSNFSSSCESFIKTGDVMLILSNVSVEGSKEVIYNFHLISSSSNSMINITSLDITSFFSSSSFFIFYKSFINIIDARVNDSFVDCGNIIETVEEINTTILNITISYIYIKEGNIINCQCYNYLSLYNFTVFNVSIEIGHIIQSHLFNSMSLAHMKVYNTEINKGNIICLFCNGFFDIFNVSFCDITLNNGNVVEMKEEIENKNSSINIRLMDAKNITLTDSTSSYIVSSSSSSVVAFFSYLSFYSPKINKNNGSIINWKAGNSSFQSCIFSGNEIEGEEEKEKSKRNDSYVQSESNYKFNNMEYVNEDEYCSFEDGILLFKGGNANFDDVSFKNFTLCALKVEDAEVNISNGEFENSVTE